MKILFSAKHALLLVGRPINLLVLFILALELLTSPASSVFANAKNTGNDQGQITLTLTVPSCPTPANFSCLAGKLTVHYVLNSNLKDNKRRFGALGIFEGDCNSGVSLLVDNVDQIRDGQDSGGFSHNVFLKKIPNNWHFCLFLSDGTLQYLAAQADFKITGNQAVTDTFHITHFSQTV